MRFSIIIPTYNRSSLIKEVIDSACNQSFKDYEIIVVNDGSTDDTESALAFFGEKIIVINQKNQGPEEARNRGTQAAKGEYFAFLDDDDIFFPWTLEIYNKVILENKFPKLVLGQPQHFINHLSNLDYQRVDNTIEFVTYNDYFSKDRPVFTSCSMITVRNDVFFEVGRFIKQPRKIDFILDDFHFLLRAGIHGPASIIYKPMQFGYRIHEQNRVKNLKRLLNNISYLIDSERSDEFAGGEERKCARYSIIGGSAFFWIRRSLSNGITRQSLGLFFKSFPMIFVSFLRKINTKMGAQKKLKTLTLG